MSGLCWFCFIGVLLSSVSSCGAEFGIHVVDESNGRGIPMATVRLANGATHLTDSAGWVRIDEPGLMHRKLRIEVNSPGYGLAAEDSDSNSLLVQLAASGDAVIKLVRLDIAERAYRITGAGIYRDSELLGREVPLPSGSFSSGLLSASGTQRITLGKKVLWCWRDALLSHERIPSLGVVGAFSQIPDSGGLDPTQGVHFSYLPTGSDQVESLLIAEEPGIMWIEGLASVQDENGADAVVAHYVRQGSKGERAEHGIALWTEEQRFERIVVLGEEYEWQFPSGQAVRQRTNEQDWCYFASPFCHVRCPARLDAVRNPAAYQALTWDSSAKAPVWQQTLPPMTQRDESSWVAEGRVQHPHTQVEDHATRKPVPVLDASIEWNPHHHCYIMIAASVDGDIWMAESTQIEGPWQRAIRIVNAEPGMCTKPVQHPFMNQEGGRIIWFETALLDTNAPRYDGNELMHRLDLDDPRLKPVLAKN